MSTTVVHSMTIALNICCAFFICSYSHCVCGFMFGHDIVVYFFVASSILMKRAHIAFLIVAMDRFRGGGGQEVWTP